MDTIKAFVQLFVLKVDLIQEFLVGDSQQCCLQWQPYPLLSSCFSSLHLGLTDKTTFAGEEMSELVERDDLCRSGEECVSQDKCPEFLDLKEQLNTGVKGTVQYNGLLTRCVLMVTRCFSMGRRNIHFIMQMAKCF